MSNTVEIHPTIELDRTVEQKNESEQHWAIKAAIVDKLRTNPACTGTIESEKKTSDLIADIRCQLSQAPSGMPQEFVVEIETAASDKDRLRATTEHIKWGFDVYWVFTLEALQTRRETENLLEEYMMKSPSLGAASLQDGEISLGSPIGWDEFSPPDPWLGQHEFYVPTYDRDVTFYNHGDFVVDGERVAIYRQAGNGMFVSRYLENGQQTIPRRFPWEKDEFLERIRTGEIQRVSPVRGAP